MLNHRRESDRSKRQSHFRLSDATRTMLDDLVLRKPDRFRDRTQAVTIAVAELYRRELGGGAGKA
jgi:hypothetical protein